MVLAKSVLRNRFSWLATLKAAELHRVAVATGISCSGTKAVLISEIERELGQLSPFQPGALTQRTPSKRTRLEETYSVVSIDMGIRNLAYAHLRADVNSQEDGEVDAVITGLPTLMEWQRLAVSRSASPRKGNSDGGRILGVADGSLDPTLLKQGVLHERKTSSAVEKESFDPAFMASHAYEFLRHIIQKHSPTHILIERQRFRSGGGSAVQEWTIRVGVFEGMLYAVLKTLSQERDMRVFVQGIDPARVARFWLHGVAGGTGNKLKTTGREGKKAKIDIIGNALEDPTSGLVDLAGGKNAQLKATINSFHAKWKKSKTSSADRTGEEIGKLDDLADCLLQGLAWIRWQNKRHEAIRHGWEAFALNTDEKSGIRSTKGRSIGKSR